MNASSSLLRGQEGIRQYRQQLRKQGQLTIAVAEAIDKAVQIRENYDQVYYLAGALTGMAETVKYRYRLASELLESSFQRRGARMFGYAPHLHGTDPARHPEVTPQDVRNIDFLFASIVPDGHINFMHPVAHGNAIEAGWAEQAGIPSIYLTPSDMRLSRLVLGMANIRCIVRYLDFATDGLEGLKAELTDVERELLSRQSPDR